MFGSLKKYSERTLISYVLFSSSANFICDGKIRFNLFVLEIHGREFLTKTIWLEYLEVHDEVGVWTITTRGVLGSAGSTG